MSTLLKASVVFGFVNIPVKIETTRSSKQISFNYLHEACKTRITQQNHCAHCNEVVDHHNLVRGYQYEPGSYVVMTDADFMDLLPDGDRSINVLGFVPHNAIPTYRIEKSYYLTPDNTNPAAKGHGYALLHTAMQQSHKTALVRFVMRSKEYAGMLMAEAEGLVLHTLVYEEEHKPIGDVIELPDATASKQELKLALEVIASYAYDVDDLPDLLHNEYELKLLEVIAEKVKGGEKKKTKKKKQKAQITNMMEALKKSVGEQKTKKRAAK